MRRPDFKFWCALMGLGGFLYAAYGVRISWGNHLYGEACLGLVVVTGLMAMVGACAAVLAWVGRIALDVYREACAPMAPMAACGPWPTVQDDTAVTAKYRKHKPPAIVMVQASELYDLRLFQLVDLARDLSGAISEARDVKVLQAHAANLRTVLSELRTRTEAWTLARVELR